MDGVQGATLHNALLGLRCSKCGRLVKGHPHLKGPKCTLAPKGTVMVTLHAGQTDCQPIHFSPSRHHLQPLTQGATAQAAVEVLW